MVFHEGFILKREDILYTPKWFAARAELYKDVSQWNNKSIDEVFFDFSAPEYGWIEVAVYVNGKKKHVFSVSAAFDPFTEIKEWMEDIVDDTKLSTDLYLELGGRTAILHYEHVRFAQVGVGRKFVCEDRDKDEWEQYDANNGAPDTGLFYIYDSDLEEIPVVSYCQTKQLLSALYNSLLYYSSRSRNAALIGKEWYYLDRDDDGNPTSDNWTFYNRIKSSLIEWNHDSRAAYRHRKPEFEEAPAIQETVHMWAEYGDGLFWHQRGGYCGNAERFFVDTGNTTIDLRDLPEVRRWYDEFDLRDPCQEWLDEEFQSWLKRGWELAKQIRKRLPSNVDLFYHWRPYVLEGEESSRDIPFIVTDERSLIKRKKNN